MNRSKHAYIGFITAGVITFSISEYYRIQFAGLYVHPYLLAIPLFGVIFSLQLHKIDFKLLLIIIIFTFIFFLVNLSDANPFIELLKIASAFLTFIFFSKTVKGRKDFEFVALGLLLCALVISVKSIVESFETDATRLSGIYVFEGIGNKNSQSLYTLPGLFFAMYFLGRSFIKRRKLALLFYASSILAIVLSMALSANRSGWISSSLIIIFGLFWNKFSIKFVILFVALSSLGYYLINTYAHDIVAHKIEVTQEGYASDEGRIELIRESFNIGFENFLFGLGKDNFHEELAKRIGILSFYHKIDSHNLFGYLFGAGGIFSFILFIAFIYYINKGSLSLILLKEQKEAKIILLCFTLLFILRSGFTRETLYSPTFFAGFGILYGYLESFKYRIQVLINAN